jgi:Zn-dependent protease
MELAFGKLRVSGAALLALAAAYFFDSGGILFSVLFAAAVHEAGHIAALKICGGRISELKLEVWGIRLRCESGMSYKTEILTAAAGPLASLVLAVAASLAGRRFNCQEAYIISGISLVFLAFNILPTLPLDGGRIIYALTAMRLGLERAERLACVLSCCVIMALLVAGTVLLIETKVNASLLLAAVWLLISYCKKSGVSIKSKRKMMEVKHG